MPSEEPLKTFKRYKVGRPEIPNLVLGLDFIFFRHFLPDNPSGPSEAGLSWTEDEPACVAGVIPVILHSVARYLMHYTYNCFFLLDTALLIASILNVTLVMALKMTKDGPASA